MSKGAQHFWASILGDLALGDVFEGGYHVHHAHRLDIYEIWNIHCHE